MKKLFRSQRQPKKLSLNDVKAMLKKFNFFDSEWNKMSQGFKNQFEKQEKNGDIVLLDQASGLMWQQSGSPKIMTYKNVQKWIDDLNEKGYAGYTDWRLPTLEEAMSLMQPKENKDGLYIDQAFDSKQEWIWTVDKYKRGSAAWGVGFSHGSCDDRYFFSLTDYVRCVRLGLSSND